MIKKMGMALFALGFLAACGQSGSEYVGQWVSQKDDRISLEISTNEDSYIVQRNAPSRRAGQEDSVKYPASLEDDGVLKVANPWGAVTLSVDQSTGRLTDGQFEYVKK